MKQVCIYTKRDVLEHKKRDGRGADGKFCYWTFSTMPTILRDGQEDQRLYFAVDSHIVGYFELHERPMDTEYNEVAWYSETWHDIEPIPQKPFQGFKYIEVKR